MFVIGDIVKFSDYDGKLHHGLVINIRQANTNYKYIYSHEVLSFTDNSVYVYKPKDIKKVS